MSEILHEKIRDDIKVWLSLDIKNNIVRLYNKHGPCYDILSQHEAHSYPTEIKYHNCYRIDFLKRINDYSLFSICYIIKTGNKTIDISLKPGLSFGTSDVKITIGYNDKVHIEPGEYNRHMKTTILDQCYNVETIYSHIEKDATIGLTLNNDTWLIPNYFQNIPKFTSFQYLLDQFNQPVIEDITIDI